MKNFDFDKVTSNILVEKVEGLQVSEIDASPLQDPQPKLLTTIASSTKKKKNIESINEINLKDWLSYEQINLMRRCVLLTPDIIKSQNSLKANRTTANNVTNYAQATVTAIPKIQNPPIWFQPIQQNLTAAQNHGNTWLRNICPAITSGVPQTIIDYNSVFKTKSRQILTVLEEIENKGGTTTSQQKDTVDSLFIDLFNAIGEQEHAISSLQSQIKTYSTEVKGDQDQLAQDLATVSEKFANGKNWIQQLTEDIGETFLESNVLGPCTTIVQIKISISLKVEESGADPSLITLVYAKAILKNQLNNFQATETAIQDILDLWTTLKVKNQAVISDLKDAQDTQYTNILKQVDLKTAQDQWNQLSEFASSLNN
ncbi:MAG: hypothetical protein AB4372_05150 [Xenococcus sp. (in: cyanobacteria)]